MSNKVITTLIVVAVFHPTSLPAATFTFITTATDTSNNTSEFSAAVAATGGRGTPVLSVLPTGANSVEVLWTPATGTNWILQERVSLSAGVWTSSPSGWTNPVVVPASLPTNSYLLFKP